MQQRCVREMPLTHLYFCLPSIDSDLPILIFTNRGVFPASVPKYSCVYSVIAHPRYRPHPGYFDFAPIFPLPDSAAPLHHPPQPHCDHNGRTPLSRCGHSAATCNFPVTHPPYSSSLNGGSCSYKPLFVSVTGLIPFLSQAFRSAFCFRRFSAKWAAVFFSAASRSRQSLNFRSR